jgi:hypothetical protein
MKSRMKLSLGVAAFVGVSASFVAVQIGTASAESVAEFRMSNFHASVGTVCVESDVETVCTGRISHGTSRVYNIRYNDVSNFKCHSKIDLAGDVHSSRFSRLRFKECLTEEDGVWPEAAIYGKQPNGKQHIIGVERYPIRPPAE